MSSRFSILRWLPSAILLIPCGVDGAIIKVVPDEPFFLTDTRFTGPIAWDVDLDGNADFLYEIDGISLLVTALEFNRFTGNGSAGAALQIGSEVGSILESAIWTVGREDLYGCASGGNGTFCGGEFEDDGILGIEFRIGGETHYGWVLIDTFPPFVSGQLVEWAYESEPNTPILAGIPEPSVTVLGGLGGFVLLFRRRRR